MKSAIIGFSTAISILTVYPAGAGQIGGLTEDYTQWQEVAGLAEARFNLAGGTLNGRLYAIGGYAPFMPSAELTMETMPKCLQVSGPDQL